MFSRPYRTASSRQIRVMLIGLGKESKLDTEALRRCAGSVVRRSAEKRVKSVAIFLPSLRGMRSTSSAQALAEGAILGSYRCDRYRATDSDGPGKVASLDLCYDRLSNARATRASAATGVILAESQNVARELSDAPANSLPPAALASEARKVARAVGLKSRVMDVAELRRRKMGGLLAVGQGSSNTPRLVVLEHNAPAKGKRPRDTVCLVGKGITFDSGGISIKPAANMGDMKHDMGGAAAVVGALRAAALLRLPLHVVGVIAAAENMPSGTAYRPGDILRSMSGKTIEILNTDAEGRVVLADALHYAREEFQPKAMLDLATLTGACMIALGPWATGVFGNNDRLVEAVRKAGDSAGERAWPMPLLQEHKEVMRSQIADLKNTGGREGGASTAAGFLSAFVGETPWVHLDIAGTAWTSKAGPYQAKGATGVGVRLLVELLRSWKSRVAV